MRSASADMLLLDISDAEIALYQDGEALYRAPGAAFAERRTVLFGHAALARARLQPRQFHNQFWQRLDATPVAAAAKGIANQADLVYRHLQEIRAAADIPAGAALVVAAPSVLDTGQLALLLGIAKEAGFAVHAIADAGVLAASTAAHAPCRFVDILLHRATVAALAIESAADGTAALARAAVDEVPGCGLASLVEGWVDAVSDRFVEATRFDPLRIAAAEQQVFDQLLAGVAAGSAELPIGIEHGGQQRRVTVGRRALAGKSRQRYALLAAALGAPGRLLLSHRTHRLPGLAEQLAADGHEIVPLAADAVAAAAGAQRGSIAPDAADEDGGARFVSSLPIRARIPSAAQSPATTPPVPTHLLCGGLAIALADGLDAADHPGRRGCAAFRIRAAEAGFAVAPDGDAALACNGEPLTGTRPLRVGDAIRCDGEEFRLIAVVSG